MLLFAYPRVASDLAESDRPTGVPALPDNVELSQDDALIAGLRTSAAQLSFAEVENEDELKRVAEAETSKHGGSSCIRSKGAGHSAVTTGHSACQEAPGPAKPSFCFIAQYGLPTPLPQLMVRHRELS